MEFPDTPPFLFINNDVMFTWELLTWHLAKSKGQMARAILKVQIDARGSLIVKKLMPVVAGIYYSQCKAESVLEST